LNNKYINLGLNSGVYFIEILSTENNKTFQKLVVN